MIDKKKVLLVFVISLVWIVFNFLIEAFLIWHIELYTMVFFAFSLISLVILIKTAKIGKNSYLYGLVLAGAIGLGILITNLMLMLYLSPLKTSTPNHMFLNILDPLAYVITLIIFTIPYFLFSLFIYLKPSVLKYYPAFSKKFCDIFPTITKKDLELRRWISDVKKKGYPNEKIKEALIKRGYSKESVEEIFFKQENPSVIGLIKWNVLFFAVFSFIVIYLLKYPFKYLYVFDNPIGNGTLIDWSFFVLPFIFSILIAIKISIVGGSKLNTLLATIVIFIFTSTAYHAARLITDFHFNVNIAFYIFLLVCLAFSIAIAIITRLILIKKYPIKHYLWSLYL